MIFTPIDAKTGKRIQIDIVENILLRGRWWAGVVEERKTGKFFVVETRDCDLQGCICDTTIYDYDGELIIAENATKEEGGTE